MRHAMKQANVGHKIWRKSTDQIDPEMTQIMNQSEEH